MDAVGQAVRSHRRPWLAATLLLVAAGLLSAAAAAAVRRPQPENAYGHTWRPADAVNFHVVANSDTQADQALKLRVRDAVMDVLMPMLAGARTADEAQATVLRERARLEHVATEALRASGAADPVRVEVIATAERRAVRVVIGRGAGHNWWCVLYPPLCLVEGETAYPATVPAFTVQTENAPAAEPHVEVRSALADWWGAARQQLAVRGLLGLRSR